MLPVVLLCTVVWAGGTTDYSNSTAVAAKTDSVTAEIVGTAEADATTCVAADLRLLLRSKVLALAKLDRCLANRQTQGWSSTQEIGPKSTQQA